MKLLWRPAAVLVGALVALTPLGMAPAGAQGTKPPPPSTAPGRVCPKGTHAVHGKCVRAKARHHGRKCPKGTHRRHRRCVRNKR